MVAVSLALMILPRRVMLWTSSPLTRRPSSWSEMGEKNRKCLQRARVQMHSWAGLKSSRIWDGEVRALGRGGDIGPRTHHVGRRDRGLEHLDRHRDERVGATLAALRKERGEGKCRVRGEREARF